MNLAIDKKVGLFISILLFTLGAILGYYFIRTQAEETSRELDERAAYLIDGLSADLEYPLLIRDQEEISRYVRKVMALKEIVFCRVEDKDGALLYQQGSREKDPIGEFTSPIITKKAGEAAEALILNAPPTETEKVGRVSLGVSLSGLNQKISNIKMTVTTIIAAAILLASLGTYLLLKRLIGAPVGQLVRATERIAAGDLASRIPLTTTDEFRVLGDSFNKMSESLLEAQEELVRKGKLAMLGQLSGSVGHELRNPLGVMSNAVYFLQTVLTDADETTKEYLGIIKKEIENSQRIITDLLDFARTKPPQWTSVAVPGLVRQSIGRSSIPDNVTAALDLPDALPEVKADPLQMGQVLVNLITNAVQAMPGGGALTIKGSEDPETGVVRVSVSDTGEGITPENMKKLFQPLFTTKARGIGLGLVVCKNLVEANGGSIEVESCLDKGTAFTIVLPVERGDE